MIPNTLHLGDNLEILKTLPSESIDFVYIDPPYNTGKIWRTSAGEFNDKFSNTEAYLEFMRPILQELHRVLKQSGSIALHCGWQSFHYLWCELAKIFNISNHINDIAWQRCISLNYAKKGFINELDNIVI